MFAEIGARLIGSRVLSFIKFAFGRPIINKWTDQRGIDHDIYQDDGGEQDDTFMFLMFFFGVRTVLVEVASKLQFGEEIAAYLDDIYVTHSDERTVVIFDFLKAVLHLHVDVDIFRTDVVEFGLEVWCSEGLVILGRL